MCRRGMSNTLTLCFTCKNQTSNPKFCSRGCAAKYNNRVFPRRQRKSKKCKNCYKLIRSNRTYCKECFGVRMAVKLQDYTLGQVIYTKHHISSSFALVRSRARNLFPIGPCQRCGYSKHTEV